MESTVRDLCERRSIRSYLEKPVEEEKLEMILRAGTYAASGMGRQSARIVLVRDPETIAYMERLNAAVLGDPGRHTFYGAPCVAVVLADPEIGTWQSDGNLVMGNLMNAAHALGVGSCYIYRAREVFDSPEGKALLRAWGIDGRYVGIGNCLLGYAAGPAPEPKPRKNDYITYIG